MLFAGLAASAAVDLLSLLQPEKPKGGTGAANATKASFSLPEDSDIAISAQSPAAAASGARSDGLSSDALGTLLSQGQDHTAHHKKRAMSVLLDLLQSSQDGSVQKSDYKSALGKDDAKASELFDSMDQNHDSSVSAAELTNFLDTYRRNAEAGTAGKGRTLAVAA
jgi:hypothetical protein